MRTEDLEDREYREDLEDREDREDHEEVLICTKDARECWDGSVIGRIPSRDCVFAPCPIKEDEILRCEDWMIGSLKQRVKNSRCVDDCDCISMFVTSLASLQCVIPDQIMETVENSHEIYHHCKDRETGESLIKPRQELLRDTQNTCRNARCEMRPEIINNFEEKDSKFRGETDMYDSTVIGMEEDKNQPDRDVDVIFEKNLQVRDLMNECLPGCDGALDQSMCEIVERVRSKNCTVVECDVDPRDVEKEILSSCVDKKVESVDMMADFGGFGSSPSSMLGIGFVGAIMFAHA